MSKLNNLLT